MYALLAELLAEPPEWMTSPGRDWQMFEAMVKLQEVSNACLRHASLVAVIPSETLAQRRERYTSLFASGKPRFWLNESAFVTGRILGEQTFEMAQLYRAAGLEPAGAELPDHISLELNFLSFLAEEIEELSFERQFLLKHGDWMVRLGRALQGCGDPVYAPIGAFLADWIREQAPSEAPSQPKVSGIALIPLIVNPVDCCLCGFCSQVCPTRALQVREDADINLLVLRPADCIHCGKCVRICPSLSLKMSMPDPDDGEVITLRRSPHERCRSCGEIIASRAEMDYIAAQIGESEWQHFCLECRSKLYV
jgi:nitrate reductase assembly molybdenum cofactor insertion protein NarJ/ferredoxin-like protein FixX